MAVPLIAVPVRLNALDVFSPIAFTVSFSLRNGVGRGREENAQITYTIPFLYHAVSGVSALQVD